VPWFLNIFNWFGGYKYLEKDLYMKEIFKEAARRMNLIDLGKITVIYPATHMGASTLILSTIERREPALRDLKRCCSTLVPCLACNAC
jgi:hypothetical protein